MQTLPFLMRLEPHIKVYCEPDRVIAPCMPLTSPPTGLIDKLRQIQEIDMTVLSFIKSTLRSLPRAAAVTCLLASTALATQVYAQEEPQLDLAKENFKGEQDAIIKCETGSMADCNYLAQNYLNRKEYQHATKYLTKICYSNDEAALKTCTAVATLLTDSTYGINDYKRGTEISEYLCDRGDSYGCLLLSNLYFLGEHVDQDLVLAGKYGQKACDLNDPVGCRQVAVITFSEAYVLKDIKIAQLSYEYHKRACELGNNDSCEDIEDYQTKIDQFKAFVQQERAKSGE